MSVKLCQFLASSLKRFTLERLTLKQLTAICLLGIFSVSTVYAQGGLSKGADGKELDITGEESRTPLSDEVEDLKKAALELNRDLLILEEELLFPANTQIMVFLSLDVGEFFRLDAVKLSIDDKLVASHLYTARQNDALIRGGVQRLYVGNLKTGNHEITAIFTGEGPDNRNYKRGASVMLDKEDDPKMLELRIRDSTANMQPDFDFKEWQL